MVGEQWFHVRGVQIMCVRVVRATPKAVWLWGNKRRARNCEGASYHPTFAEAKTELLARLRIRIAQCETEIKDLQDERALALRWIGDLVNERITEALIRESAACK